MSGKRLEYLGENSSERNFKIAVTMRRKKQNIVAPLLYVKEITARYRIVLSLCVQTAMLIYSCFVFPPFICDLKKQKKKSFAKSLGAAMDRMNE